MSKTLSRLAAIKALRRAHSHAKWGIKDLTRNKRLTAGLVSRLEAHRHLPEVGDFLRRLQQDPTHVDSRELHYMQRRYVDGRPLDSASAMDALFARVLDDPAAKVYQYGGLRYQIRSPREDWIAILDPDGTRVSIYPDLDDDLGDPLWTLKDLIP